MKKTLAPTAIAFGASAVALTSLAPSAGASSVYYPNCSAAVAAHAAPIAKGEPGYRPGLDEDHDGTACDKDLPAGYVKKSPTKPAPTATSAPSASSTKSPTPSSPATPAPGKSAPSGVGPTVNTDYVKPAGTNDTNILVASGAVAGLVGLGAWRLRTSKR